MDRENGYEVFSPDELAEKWRASRKLVDRLIAQGKLRAFKVGQLTRITLDSVREFERENPRPITR